MIKNLYKNDKNQKTMVISVAANILFQKSIPSYTQ